MSSQTAACGLASQASAAASAVYFAGSSTVRVPVSETFVPPSALASTSPDASPIFVPGVPERSRLNPAGTYTAIFAVGAAVSGTNRSMSVSAFAPAAVP